MSGILKSMPILSIEIGVLHLNSPEAKMQDLPSPWSRCGGLGPDTHIAATNAHSSRNRVLRLSLAIG